MRVLFADDDALHATLLRYGFQDAKISCELHHVSTGAAVYHWLSRNDAPDAVILDLRMATESGLDVLKALETQPSLGRVPKLILSSAAAPHLTSEIAAHGGIFFEKPFELEGWAHIARTMNTSRQSPYALR